MNGHPNLALSTIRAIVSTVGRSGCARPQFGGEAAHKSASFSPLTMDLAATATHRGIFAMRNSSRSALMHNGKREFPAALPYAPPPATPVPPGPDWSPEFPSDEAPTRIDVRYDYRDQESWVAPARSSVVRSIVPLRPLGSERPSRVRQSAAKLRLAVILSAISAVLAFGLLSARLALLHQ